MLEFGWWADLDADDVRGVVQPKGVGLKEAGYLGAELGVGARKHSPRRVPRDQLRRECGAGEEGGWVAPP
eukprot:7639780-Pyramimonas_sp.AAC.1